MKETDIKISGSGCNSEVAAWRSPNVSNANNPRNCNTSGAVNNNNANNANGLAPDCEYSEHGVTDKAKREHSRKELLPCSDEKPDKTIMCSDAEILRDVRAIDAVFLEVCSFDNLYRAALICKRNVTWKASVLKFINNLLTNIYKLRSELFSGTYHISNYSIFYVHEKKTRLIVATRMRDRVFQRSLCDNYLYNEITRHFIKDNCTCQIGKGTDFARERLKYHLRRFYRKHGTDGYVLKIDIHDFFGSTPHDKAKEVAKKRIRNEWALSVVYDIIDSYDHLGGERGLGLGSQITQLIELSMLDDIDHYIKERLKIKYYVRYNDDMILIHEDKEHLKKCAKDIIKMISDLGLEVNEKKTFIQKINKGIHFLGFSFTLTDTGKVLMIILRKKLSKERHKLKRQYKVVLSGRMTIEHFEACYGSWRAHASKGNNRKDIGKMDEIVKQYKEDYENVRIYSSITAAETG